MLGREWIEFQSGPAGVELHRVAPGSERFLLSGFLVVYRCGLYRDRHRQSDRYPTFPPYLSALFVASRYHLRRAWG